MCKMSALRSLVVEKLSAAAEEIFSAVEKMITETKMQHVKEINQQRAAVQKRLSEVADDICKMLAVMMGGYESEVPESYEEVKLQLLNITSKTDTHLHQTGRLSGSDYDMDISYEQRRSNNKVHKTSGIQQVECTSTETDSEFIHGEPSHLQPTQKMEKFTSALMETTNTAAESDCCEVLNVKPLESDKRKLLMKDQMDNTETETQSSDTESKEGDSDKEWTESVGAESSESDGENWTKPITKNPKPNRAEGTEGKDSSLLKYHCKVCNRPFSIRAYLLKHVKKEENDKDICGVCGEHFPSKQSLRFHLQTYFQTNDCEVCCEQLDRPEQLEMHMRMHTGEEPYICGVCGKDFALKENLKVHVRIHSREKSSVCSRCGQSFRQKPGFRESLDLCEVCRTCQGLSEDLDVEGNVLQNQTSDQHMGSSKTGHIVEEKGEMEQASIDAHGKKTPKRTKNIVSSYLCKVCGRSFSYKAWFINHVREDEKDKDICGVCGKHFESAENLILHLETCIQRQACEVCGKRFKSPLKMKVHMKKHKGERPYICNVCKSTFEERSSLMKHMQSHKTEMLFICSVCGQSYRPAVGVRQKQNLCEACSKHLDSGESLSVQSEVDNGENVVWNQTEDMKMESCDVSRKADSDHNEKDGEQTDNIDCKYPCRVCRRSFCFRASLLNHVKKVEKDKDICGVCGKHFESEESLRLHLETYSQTNDCEVCGKRFDAALKLETHMRTHTGEKPFTCSICGKTFSVKGNLMKHMLVHTGKKTYFCSVCSQSFLCKQTMVSHMKTHSDERPFLCSTCGKTFKQRGHLTTHMKIHKGEFVHCCSVCNKKFHLSGLLKKHMRSHTGERPFQCNVCEKCLSSRYALNKHIETHEGGQNHSCNVCGKRYRWKESLRKHLKTHRIIHTVDEF